MKDNHIPRRERLEHRISNLYGKVPGSEPIGGGNPYHRCRGCGRSEPDISNNGHYSDCPKPGIEKEIRHYQSLLKEELERLALPPTLKPPAGQNPPAAKQEIPTRRLFANDDGKEGYDLLDPSGNIIGSLRRSKAVPAIWHLRDAENRLVDYDRHQNDIRERRGIEPHASPPP